jgi:hypothetical protein
MKKKKNNWIWIVVLVVVAMSFGAKKESTFVNECADNQDCINCVGQPGVCDGNTLKIWEYLDNNEACGLRIWTSSCANGCDDGYCIISMQCTGPLANDGDYVCIEGNIYQCDTMDNTQHVRSGGWTVGANSCGSEPGETGDCTHPYMPQSTIDNICDTSTIPDDPCTNPTADDGWFYCDTDYDEILYCDDGTWYPYEYCSSGDVCVDEVPSSSPNLCTSECTCVGPCGSGYVLQCNPVNGDCCLPDQSCTCVGPCGSGYVLQCNPVNGDCCLPESSNYCVDTDGSGNAYGEKGKVYMLETPNTFSEDYCIGGTQLMEYYCIGTSGIGSTTYDCGSGEQCSDGACVPADCDCSVANSIQCNPDGSKTYKVCDGCNYGNWMGPTVGKCGTDCTSSSQCDDNVACTSDTCTNGICENADNCPSGQACDAGTGVCTSSDLSCAEAGGDCYMNMCSDYSGSNCSPLVGKCTQGYCCGGECYADACADLGGAIKGNSCDAYDMTVIMGASDADYETSYCCKLKEDNGGTGDSTSNNCGGNCLSLIEECKQVAGGKYLGEDGLRYDCKVSSAVLILGGFIGLMLVFKVIGKSKQ